VVDIDQLKVSGVHQSDGDLKVNFSLHTLKVEDMRPNSELAERR
jgi:hypothetical protein